MSVTADGCDVAHTFDILARELAFESGALIFFSRKVIRLSWPPSRFEAALLCFHPRMLTCSRLLPLPPCRMLTWEVVLPEIAFWIASTAGARGPEGRPESPRALLPRPRAPPPAASISISPSRSTRVGPPRLRMPPRSVPPERREPFPPFILLMLSVSEVAVMRYKGSYRGSLRCGSR